MIPSSAYIAVGQYLLKKSQEYNLNHICEIESKNENDIQVPSHGTVLYDILRDLGADMFIDFFL